MLNSNLIHAVRQGYDSLRRPEKKVADLVLDTPGTCINSSIAELARQARVSEPTVVRFCRVTGCSGYQEFKLKLAQSLGNDSQFAAIKLEKNDSISQISRKVFTGTIRELLNVWGQVNEETYSGP